MKNKILWGIAGAVCAILLFTFISYNSIIRSSLAVDQQWAQVESQYQRRFDLIPNLVAAVQGSMKQEKDIFLGIANSRQAYAGASTVDQKVTAAGQMDSALSRLLVVMEQYPQLKSNENVSNLMTGVESTENRIATERMRYNNAVTDYNTKIKLLPGSIIANMFGFTEKTLFKSDVGANKAVKVQF